LEALVVTHYDLDHIEGVIELLQARPEWLDIKDIWFNGYQHLAPTDVLGSAEGDALVELIELRDYPWNLQFGGGTIKIGNKQPLEMPGGLKVWILSPDQDRLTKLAAEWGDGKIVPESSELAVPDDLLRRKDKWPPLEFADLASAPFSSDRSAPNGSSIALLLEFNDQRMLLTGDAFAAVVSDAIEEYWDTPPLVHLLKVSHHGSKANTTEKLLQSLQCKRFLISTSGKGHGHPDHVLIARPVGST
jgi:beta-lactamase superfamily II metal-dependent hydrolase